LSGLRHGAAAAVAEQRSGWRPRLLLLPEEFDLKAKKRPLAPSILDGVMA
jgi:hypothetical protein